MADDDDSKTIAKLEARLTDLTRRYDSLREQHAAAEASIKGIAKERDSFKAQASTVEALQATADKLRADLEAATGRADHDLAMADAGVRDPRLRKYLRYQFSEHVEEAGDKAQEFAAWWAAQQADPGPVLAAALAPADASAQPAAEPAEPSTPAAAPAVPARNGAVRTEAGVRPTPSPPSEYQLGEITAMPLEQLKEVLPELLATTRFVG